MLLFLLRIQIKKNGCLEIANKNETFKILGSKWEDITKKTYIYTPKYKKEIY